MKNLQESILGNRESTLDTLSSSVKGDFLSDMFNRIVNNVKPDDKDLGDLREYCNYKGFIKCSVTDLRKNMKKYDIKDYIYLLIPEKWGPSELEPRGYKTELSTFTQDKISVPETAIYRFNNNKIMHTKYNV